MPMYRSYPREKFHLKKMYCMNCACTIDHVEWKREEEDKKVRTGSIKLEPVLFLFIDKEIDFI